VCTATAFHWSGLLEIDGDAPAPRDSHAAAAVGKFIFVIAGTNGVTQFDDVTVLDTGRPPAECGFQCVSLLHGREAYLD